MINSREILAVVAMEFSMKREFRKIQCPLFFSLDSYIYTYLYMYIYYICIYIYSSHSYMVCYTLNGTSDRRNPPTAGNLGRGEERGGKEGRKGDHEGKKTPVSDIQR